MKTEWSINEPISDQEQQEPLRKIGQTSVWYTTTHQALQVVYLLSAAGHPPKTRLSWTSIDANDGDGMDSIPAYVQSHWERPRRVHGEIGSAMA